MSINKTQIVADLRSLIAEDSHFAVIGAQTISVSKTKLENERIYGEHGYGEEYRISITGAAADLSTVPKKGTSVTIDGTAYLVIDFEKDSLDTAFILHLGESVS